MDTWNWKERKEQVREQLDESRYEHTLGVMYTAGAMAMRYHCDLNQAMMAGLLHDCAKCLSSSKKIELCNENHIEISESEAKNPSLLHAKLGAFIAKRDYGVEDEAVLESIRNHTTGKPDMTLLDKIIYIADYIEPGRDVAPNLDLIRRLAFEDIDECLYQILCDSLEYLKTKHEVIDPLTEQTYMYYKERRTKDGTI